MKINGTEWYTACGTRFTPIEGSERTQVQTLYGYRLPVGERKEREVKELMDLLKADGVQEIKLKTSKHDHTGIPKGTPFLEVLEERSAIALEKLFLEQGLTLRPDRYQEYGLEYINRYSRNEVKPAIKKSLLARLLGR